MSRFYCSLCIYHCHRHYSLCTVHPIQPRVSWRCRQQTWNV